MFELLRYILTTNNENNENTDKSNNTTFKYDVSYF